MVAQILHTHPQSGGTLHHLMQGMSLYSLLHACRKAGTHICRCENANEVFATAIAIMESPYTPSFTNSVRWKTGDGQHGEVMSKRKGHTCVYLTEPACSGSPLAEDTSAMIRNDSAGIDSLLLRAGALPVSRRSLPLPALTAAAAAVQKQGIHTPNRFPFFFFLLQAHAQLIVTACGCSLHPSSFVFTTSVLRLKFASIFISFIGLVHAVKSHSHLLCDKINCGGSGGGV